MRIASLTAAATVLLIGCNNPQQSAEIARLEGQLAQADSRVAVATEQVEAANTQVKSLNDSLLKALAEIGILKRKNESDRTKAGEQVELARSDARRAWLKVSQLEAKLDEIERQKIQAEKLVDLVGAWYWKNESKPRQADLQRTFCYRMVVFLKDGKPFARFHVRGGYARDWSHTGSLGDFDQHFPIPRDSIYLEELDTIDRSKKTSLLAGDSLRIGSMTFFFRDEKSGYVELSSEFFSEKDWTVDEYMRPKRFKLLRGSLVTIPDFDSKYTLDYE